MKPTNRPPALQSQPDTAWEVVLEPLPDRQLPLPAGGIELRSAERAAGGVGSHTLAAFGADIWTSAAQRFSVQRVDERPEGQMKSG